MRCRPAEPTEYLPGERDTPRGRAPRIRVETIGTLNRGRYRVSLGVLHRDGSPPRLSIAIFADEQSSDSSPAQGRFRYRARTEFSLDDLDELERAIEATRRAARETRR